MERVFRYGDTGKWKYVQIKFLFALSVSPTDRYDIKIYHSQELSEDSQKEAGVVDVQWRLSYETQ